MINFVNKGVRVMLDNGKIVLLRNKGIDENDIQNIVSYNESTGEVIFNDGRKRTLTEIVERCMGYFRPVDQWNIGKRQEHKDRKYFNQKEAFAKCVNTINTLVAE